MQKILPLLFMILSTLANAKEITQNFSSSWSIDPWSYYGETAAIQWQYLEYEPWNSALGTLTSVTVTTSITGTRQQDEELKYRYSFFTGWNPADYQFYREAVLPANSLAFSFEETFNMTSEQALAKWTRYSLFTPANYYFESSTLSNGHSINVSTNLIFSYTSTVPEMPTVALYGLGILCLTLMRRRVIA